MDGISIDKLHIDIVVNTETALSKINKVMSKINELSKEADKLNTVYNALDRASAKASKAMDAFSSKAKNGMADAMHSMVVYGEELNRTFERMRESFMRFFRDWSHFKPQGNTDVANYNAPPERDDNIIDGVFTEISGALPKFEPLQLTDTLSQPILLLEDLSKTTEGVVQTIEKTNGRFDKFNKIIRRTIQLLQKLKDVTKGTQNIFDKLPKPVKKSHSVFGKLLGQFKRILTYRIIRSIIGEMGNAFSTGVNNVYQYSKAIGGELANSLDSLATNLLYVRNSIGAMVAPLINALAPAIDFVTDKIVGLINQINILFAKLTNSGTWTKAIKKETQFAESAERANKALTAGIDELNILSATDSSSGTDMSDAFTTEDIATAPANSLVDAIANGDWSAVGESIGNAIANIDITSILSAVGGWALEIGKAVSGFFTGFFKSDLFKGVSETFGEIIGVISEKWQVVKEFLSGIFAEPIEVITTAFSRIWSAMSDTFESIAYLWTAILKPIVIALKDYLVSFWNSTLKPILSFITGVFLNNIANTLNYLKSSFLTTVQFIGGAVQSLLQVFSGLITFITGTLMGNWKKAGEGLKQVFRGVVNGIISLCEGAINIIINGLNYIIGKASAITEEIGEWIGMDFTLGKIERLSIPRLADGGYVNQGQLFIAREAGAEMVGKIGNRVGAVNNDQIVSAISDGVYRAVVSASSQSSGNSNINVYLDGKQIESSVRKTSQRRGAVIGTGGIVNGSYA